MPTVLFDAYGTLFDLESALNPVSEKLGLRADAVFDRWRTLQLEYAWLSVLRGARLSFAVCTRTAFLDALSAEGIQDEVLVEKLAEGFRNVSPYPDAAECLKIFSNAGWQTAILSNGEPPSLQLAVDAAGLGEDLDDVLSVTASGTYKPAPAAYDIGTQFATSSRSETLFVSSNWWDVIGARDYGFRTGLITRHGKFWPASEQRPELSAISLTDLAKTVVD